MHLWAVVSGIVSLLAAGGLLGVGSYDGVLTQSAIDPLPPVDEPQAVTLRITVLDEPRPIDEVLQGVAQGVEGAALVVPQALRLDLTDGGQLTAVAAEGSDAIVYARFGQLDAHEPGERLVVRGQLAIHYILVEDHDGPTAVPILILTPQDAHKPLVFD